MFSSLWTPVRVLIVMGTERMVLKFLTHDSRSFGRINKPLPKIESNLMKTTEIWLKKQCLPPPLLHNQSIGQPKFKSMKSMSHSFSNIAPHLVNMCGLLAANCTPKMSSVRCLFISAHSKKGKIRFQFQISWIQPTLRHPLQQV